MIFKLFFVFLKIGCLSFGGGYATLPLLQEQIVLKHHWLTMKEFIHLITISQMTPGPIAINGATFIGQRLAGWQGALFATIGCILPSLCIVFLLTILYLKYKNLESMQKIFRVLRPVVVALIASSAVSILDTSLSQDSLFVLFTFFVCFYFLQKKKTNPIWVMVLSGFVYMIYSLF